MTESQPHISNPTGSASTTEHQWSSEAHRLHPLTLVYRGVLSLPGFVFLLYPAFREQSAESVVNLVLAVVYGVLVLPWIFLYYRRFQYSITPKEVIIRQGILTRQDRTIPIERIQNVEIIQRLLARALGIAQLRIETGGSATTEGSLEYIALSEAEEVRKIIRSYQQAASRDGAGDESVRTTEEEKIGATSSVQEAEPVPVYGMTPKEVILSGAFRISLVFIAVFFTGLQYLGIRDEQIVAFILDNSDVAANGESPTLLFLSSLILAIMLGWVTSIVLAVTRYWRLQLTMEGRKLHRRHGLFTRLEGTLPLDRIQVLVVRANALMHRYKYAALEAQTMGADARQEGKQIVVPLGNRDSLLALGSRLKKFVLPEVFDRTSRVMIRRLFVRYSVVITLSALLVSYFWLESDGWYLAVLYPLALLWAVLEYRYHTYAFNADTLFIRRGVWLRRLWIVPMNRVQVLTQVSNYFQRRLGLRTLLIDTAGSESFSPAYIRDLPEATANHLLRLWAQRVRTNPSTVETEDMPHQNGGRENEGAIESAGNGNAVDVKEESRTSPGTGNSTEYESDL